MSDSLVLLTSDQKAEIDLFCSACWEEVERIKRPLIPLLPVGMQRTANFDTDAFIQCVAAALYESHARAEDREAGCTLFYWLWREEKRQKDALKNELQSAIFPVVEAVSFDDLQRPTIDGYHSLPVPDRLDAILNAVRSYLPAMGNATNFSLRAKTVEQKENLLPCFQLLRSRVGKATWWRKGNVDTALIDIQGLETLPAIEYWHIRRDVLEAPICPEGGEGASS